MANNSGFINIATILWAANIAALMDEAGKPIVPNTMETVNAGTVVLAFIRHLILHRIDDTLFLLLDALWPLTL